MPRYANPVLDADWPDPDVIRVEEAYYLVASSFNRVPGLPILRSVDLVDWEIVGHALAEVPPAAHYALPRPGCGVWAPSLRHHDGRFVVVYPDPDHGLFVVTSESARGPWTSAHCLLPGQGMIDPCPLWDDDGRAYVVFGWARSRSGIANRLSVVEVEPDLSAVIGVPRTVIDGDELPGFRTLEGPKFYRRNGWYWIFAPAGGVETGWQSVFRSRSVWGPYQERRVLEQGSTPVNGPHQGGWVTAVDGSDWFMHFQDRGCFGRVVHLQPMRWGETGRTGDKADANPGGDNAEANPGGDNAEANPGGDNAEANPGGDNAEANPGGDNAEANPGGDNADGWPVLGVAGEPVLNGETPGPDRRPGRPRPTAGEPSRDDDFGADDPDRRDRIAGPGPIAGLNRWWHWSANPEPGWYQVGSGQLRLTARPRVIEDLRQAPNVLAQQLPGQPGTISTTIGLEGDTDGLRAGLVVLGARYQWVGLQRRAGRTRLVVGRSDELGSEILLHARELGPAPTKIDLQAHLDAIGIVRFLCRVGEDWQRVGPDFQAEKGRWIGAEIGLFADRPSGGGPGAGRFGPWTVRFDLGVGDEFDLGVGDEFDLGVIDDATAEPGDAERRNLQ